MRRILTTITLLIVCITATATPKPRISGAELGKFTIIYNSESENEEGAAIAEYFKEKMGLALQESTADKIVRGRKIIIGSAKPSDTFEYSIETRGGNMLIDGGGCWALQKAVDIVACKLAEGNIPAGFKVKGSVYGEHLFPITEGANLRILDDNIWDYSSSTLPAKWAEMGEDPRDSVRCKGFAQLVRAYMPDIITLQEYSSHMHGYFYSLIQEYGYEISYESGKDWNNTPIFYNRETISQVSAHYNLYTPETFCNHGSKSFTSAIFQHKATGREFAVVTTHLWWKSDKVQPGSTMARASQIRLIMAEVEMLKAEHDCPFFITGDMNCEENTIPMQQFLQEGYLPCYKASTGKTDLNPGHHICSAGDGFSRVSRRKPGREIGAIDHCLVFNGKDNTEIKSFECVMAAFTVKLTDHYPNVIDICLK